MAESRLQTKGWDGIKKPPGFETAFNTVLSVSPNDEDCASLGHIFKSDWTVIASATVASALSVKGSPQMEPDIWLQPEHGSRGANQMEAIYLTDDELKRLEARFGPLVRQMGPWNSEGVFGYASVPIVAVEKAAETLANPHLLTALPRLRTPERTKTFIELLEDFGSVLVERIVGAYRECPLWPHPSVSMNSWNPW